MLKVVSAQEYMIEAIIKHIFIVGVLLKYASTISTISVVVSTISTVVSNISHYIKTLSIKIMSFYLSLDSNTYEYNIKLLKRIMEMILYSIRCSTLSQ